MQRIPIRQESKWIDAAPHFLFHISHRLLLSSVLFNSPRGMKYSPERKIIESLNSLLFLFWKSSAPKKLYHYFGVPYIHPLMFLNKIIPILLELTMFQVKLTLSVSFDVIDETTLAHGSGEDKIYLGGFGKSLYKKCLIQLLCISWSWTFGRHLIA